MGSNLEAPITKKTLRLSLEVALDNARTKFAKQNPRSQTAFESGSAYMPGANTRTVIHAHPFPLTFSEGRSAMLTTVDGTSYIDFLGEYTAGVYGHSCEPIKAAIHEALARGWNYGGKNEWEAELSRIIVNRFSNSIDMIRFCNSGTEANLMALGAAINFTGKKKILAFWNGYHGSSISFPLAKAVYSMNPPYNFVLATYNDIASVDAVISGLDKNSLAAIIVEGMQGAGGCIPGNLEFLRHLRTVANEQKALLILDEVMTSRLAYGGLQSKLGIKPDMTTLGKWLGGGMTFGAFGGRRDVMGMFDPREGQLVHSGTFNNNVVTMAAGIAGCSVFDENAVEALNRLGETLRIKVNDVIATHLRTRKDTTANVFATGIGSILNVTFVGPDKDILQALFYHHMLDQGIYIATRGMVALNLQITEEHIAKFMQALEDFVILYQKSLAA